MAYTQANISGSITTYAAKYGVPANLVAGVLLKESSWDPYPKRGSCGEIGPMQIIPPSASSTSVVYDLVRNGSLPSEALTDEWLSNPDNNIKAGTLILKKYSNGGDLTQPAVQERTLEAYNAGPGTTSQGKSYSQDVMQNKIPAVDRSRTLEADSDGSAIPDGGTNTSSPLGIAGGGASNTQSATGRTGASNLEPDWDFSIEKFAKFIAVKTFWQYMQKTYEQSMEQSLHTFIVNFMQKFYHTITYIPTLPNCMAIVVKPDTYFVGIPSCNVVMPTLKSGINFTRNHRMEPTRMLVSSDPIQGLLGGSGAGTIGIVNTLAFMDYESSTSKKEVVKDVQVLKSLLDKTGDKPLLNCTEYERKNGVRIQRLPGGDDFYLFMLGSPGTSKAKNAEDRLMKLNRQKITEASAVLTKLAKYHLLRARYDQRPGSVSMFFNPYIVPSFPMVSIEGVHESNINVIAYVTSVQHTLSANGATTAASFTGTHISSDAEVQCMPIVEEPYEKGVAETYKNLFGEAVTVIPQATGVKTVIDKFKETKGSVAETLKQIWRPLTTRDEYMKTLAHDAKIDESGQYSVMTSKFFKTETQALLKEYSDAILVNKNAFHEPDVR